MFLSMHVSPRVVKETSRDQARFAAPALQKEIMRLLHRHGVLAFLSKAEATAMLDALKQPTLEPREVKAWQETLVYLNKLGRLGVKDPAVVEGDLVGATPQDIEAIRRLAPVLSVVSSETYGHMFPEATDGAIRLEGDAEFVAPGSLGESGQVQRVEKLAEVGSVPAGTSREDVWRDLFAPLASVSKQVSLFDRYLYADLDDPVRTDHLPWLLGRLDQVAPSGAVVKLFGARGIDGNWGPRISRDAREASQFLEDYLPGDFERISVEAWLAPSTRTADMHHDRHIRFGAGAALVLPAGFDRLGAPRLKEAMGFAYRHAPETLSELQARETQVARNGASASVRAT